MIVYKVVRVEDDKLKSTFPRRNRPRSRVSKQYAQLTYEPGKVTIPKFGKIFAFATKDDACYFALGRLHNNQVWEAETPDAEPIKEIAGDGGWGATTLYRFKAFWEGKDISDWMPAPTGTVVCSELTLIKHIK